MATSPTGRRPNWHDNVFFGLHFDLHPNETDTELGAATTYAHIRAELEKVKPDWVMYDCKGVPGYAGYPTQVGLPSPGIVKDALKIWRKVTRDLGIPLSVHYCGLWDDAQWQRRPDWAALRPDGTRYGESKFDGWSSHPMSFDGPYGDQVLIPQLLEVIDLHDVDGVWVDADAWVAVPDWGETTQRLFLEELQRSNRSDRLERSDLSVPMKPGDPNWLEYMAFNRQRYAAYLTRYCDALHARKPSFAVCSNWAYSARMPEDVTTPVDYLSGDYTWTFAADSISLEGKTFDSRGLPWDLMGWGFTSSGPMSKAQWTTRSVDELSMEGALVMSNGGAFWIYDTPIRNGRLVDWHMDVFAEVGRFLRRRQRVFQGTTSAPHVALLHSESHFYAHSHPNGPGPLHHAAVPLRTMTGALQLLLQNHYHADVTNEATLQRMLTNRPIEDGEGYSVVVIAEQTNLPEELKAALVEWVKRGGKLLLTGSHIVQDWADVAGVANLLGVNLAAAYAVPSHDSGEPNDDTRYVAADGGAVPVIGPWQPVTLAGGRALAPLYKTPDVKHDRLPYPAATLKKVGKGAVAAIYGPIATMFADYRYPLIRSFFGNVIKALTGPMPVEIDAPAYVHMTVRQQPGRQIINLVNTASENPQTPVAPLIERVPDAGPITVRVQCDKRPKSVTLAPQGKLKWTWAGGWVTATIEALRIHTALVVEWRP